MILVPLHAGTGRSTQHPSEWGYVLWTEAQELGGLMAELIVVLACLLALVGFGLLILNGGDATCVNAGRGMVVCH